MLRIARYILGAADRRTICVTLGGNDHMLSVKEAKRLRYDLRAALDARCAVEQEREAVASAQKAKLASR